VYYLFYVHLGAIRVVSSFDLIFPLKFAWDMSLGSCYATTEECQMIVVITRLISSLRTVGSRMIDETSAELESFR
jgi:hypothetical protein